MARSLLPFLKSLKLTLIIMISSFYIHACEGHYFRLNKSLVPYQSFCNTPFSELVDIVSVFTCFRDLRIFFVHFLHFFIKKHITAYFFIANFYILHTKK